MIYLTTLLLLSFFFGASKDLIRDSQKLQFCNFVRLSEKFQNNIRSKLQLRKKPSTLEKDKEDHRKYYLSYPKPPVLDMEWETSDINVVERSNTEKFSKIDNIVTALRLLELLFHDALVDMIVGYTKLYSLREKIDISFEITNEKICLFLSMLLTSGCHKLLDRKMYWKMILEPDTRCDQCLAIRSSVFFGIFIFLTMSNLNNKTNSRSSFAWLMSQIGDF